MSSTIEIGTGIRPFTVDVPEEELAERRGVPLTAFSEWRSS
jgi:hypothetical protein